MSGWDANDPFDMVANMEGNLYERAFHEGVVEAQQGDVREQGRTAGRLKGYAIGIELGFMQAATQATEPSNDASLSKRVAKRRSELLGTASAIPNVNSNEIDYEEAIRNLRALYKQCDVPAGPFIGTSCMEFRDNSQSW